MCATMGLVLQGIKLSITFINILKKNCRKLLKLSAFVFDVNNKLMTFSIDVVSTLSNRKGAYSL